MPEKTNNDVHEAPHALSLVAVFLAGVTLAATVAILAARTQGDRMARRTDNALNACDRAMEKLEQRVRSVDTALAG